MKTIFLVFLALLCASCAANGPILGAGAAAMLVAFDQMLAAGTIEPAQHQALTQGLGSIQSSVATLQEAQAGRITTGEAVTALGGTAAGILGAIRVWRGASDKGPLVKRSATNPA